MIARLGGALVARRPDHVVVDVAGVGYRVFITLAAFCDLPDLGREVAFHIHTIVREDAIHLYGFPREDEWAAFAQLLAVKGVGPKLALGILSSLAPRDLWAAVRAGDASRLNKVPGVGKKTAAQLILDLAGRLPAETSEAPSTPAPPASPLADDAQSALMNLGYPEAKAAKAVETALAELDPTGQTPPSLEDLLRNSLKKLL
ncbi:MAG: Holliday junction branch migration protein RuvA [Deltaproteobacteria bacterium]|nr:Holliday junction branch migration protein RuvA [Deltaproteobacteria bacterium]